MDDKTKAIVAHLFGLGWIIALIMNQNDKGPLTSFYLRQNLGFIIIWVAGIVLGMITISTVTMIIGIVILIVWILSLLGALSGEQKPTPVVGEMFQTWFKNIS